MSGIDWTYNEKLGRYTTALWDGLMEGCGTCTFARTNMNNPQGWHTQAIECCRYPPKVVINNAQPTQMRPRAADSDWCGEYKRNQP